MIVREGIVSEYCASEVTARARSIASAASTLAGFTKILCIPEPSFLLHGIVPIAVFLLALITDPT
jgi:hypothetical protein